MLWKMLWMQCLSQALMGLVLPLLLRGPFITAACSTPVTMSESVGGAVAVDHDHGRDGCV